MQLINLPNPENLKTISASVEGSRLARYNQGNGKNLEETMSFYLWNAELCREFYHPLHFAEILCRNRINYALKLHISSNWYENQTLHKILADRFRGELFDVIDSESKQHGNSMNCDHVVSALSFGFWGHLTTKRFERLLWRFGVHKTFNGATQKDSRQDLYDLIESVRRWRNRIAHHRAIFDKKPESKFDDASKLIAWCCIDTAAWISQNTKFYEVLGNGPQIFIKDAAE